MSTEPTGLEPNAEAVLDSWMTGDSINPGHGTFKGCVQLSIAISLRRIADSLAAATDHSYNAPAFRTRRDTE